MSISTLGPETRAIIKELKSISNVLVGSVPDNIEFGQLLHTQETLDKIADLCGVPSNTHYDIEKEEFKKGESK